MLGLILSQYYSHDHIGKAVTYFAFQQAPHNLIDNAKLSLPAREIPHAYKPV